VRVVLDRNVVLSGLFFGGVPGRILACAIGGRAKILVSGDRALLRATGFGGVLVLTPRAFADAYL